MEKVCESGENTLLTKVINLFSARLQHVAGAAAVRMPNLESLSNRDFVEVLQSKKGI